MPKRKDTGSSGGDPLANEEVSLKEKYAAMRAKKEQQQEKDKDEKAKLEAQKMAHAKKILAASLSKEVKEEKPMKKPPTLERKLTEMKERGIVPEPKRAKVEDIPQDRPPRQERDRERDRERERERRDGGDHHPPQHHNPPYNRGDRDRDRERDNNANMNEPHPYYYRDKPTQYPRRDEPVELTDEGEYYPTTIFVGDLTEEVTLPELEKEFTRFGEIDSLRPVAGKNFVFIKFKNRDAALRSIVEMNGFVINNVRLRVHRAKVPAAKGRWAGRGRRHDSGGEPHSEDHNDSQAPNNTSQTSTEGSDAAAPHTVEYNPTKFIPKIPKMTITQEQQEQQQLLNSRTLRNYDDL